MIEIPRCLPSNPSDKKSQIIAAAVKIFSEKGFHAAKVEEIAVEAGVGKGTVYEYFSSKANLFQEMMRSCMESYMKSFKENLDLKQTAREQLTTIMFVHLQFLANNEGITKFATDSHPPMGDEMREWFLTKKAEMLEGLAAILRIGIKRGEIRQLNTAVAAHIILGAMMNLSSEIVLGRKSAAKEDVINEAIDIIFQGLEV